MSGYGFTRSRVHGTVKAEIIYGSGISLDISGASISCCNGAGGSSGAGFYGGGGGGASYSFGGGLSIFQCGVSLVVTRQHSKTIFETVSV